MAGLPVGAVQRQGVGHPAVAVLTRTDAGRPERRRERKDKDEEMEKSLRHGGEQELDPCLKELKLTEWFLYGCCLCW